MSEIVSIVNPTITQTCRKCGLVKPYEEFYHEKGVLKKNAKSVGTCLICQTKKRVVYYNANAEKIKKYSIDRYYKNVDKIKIYHKNRYEQHKERILKSAKIYRDVHKKQKSIMDKKYRENNKEKIILSKKIEYQRNRDKYIRRSKLWHKNLRLEIFSHYGGCKCTMCGNTHYEHLTIDHKLNNGAVHRRKYKTPGEVYKNIKALGFPPNEYQVLCYNCNCTKNRKEVSQNYNSKIRLKIIELLGNKCVCCGETNLLYLTIDHINGGGTKLYRKIGSYQLYKDLLARGVPKDEVRVLCYNCNCSRGVHGYCPHRNLKEDQQHE